MRLTLACLAALTLSRAAGAQGHRHRAERAPPEPSGGWRTLASLRVVGGATHVWGAGADALTSWTVDVYAGLRLLDARVPTSYRAYGGDVGLSIGPRGGDTQALWLAGPGISYGRLWLMVGWSPRLVLGSVGDRTALGVRNTLSVCTFVGVVCVDVAHQYLSVQGGSQQDLRFGVGLDLGMILQALVQFAGARPG